MIHISDVIYLAKNLLLEIFLNPLTLLPLEDEHERRAVHTTKEPKHRENTE